MRSREAVANMGELRHEETVRCQEPRVSARKA
jgi:hypothetical protein